MPAIFHGLGTADHWVRPRVQQGGTLPEDEAPSDYGGGAADGNTPNEMEWLYLGTSVLAPLIDVEMVTTPVLCDFNAPVPLNRIYHGELHKVTTTLNRLNYVTYNRIRAKLIPGRFGVRRIDSMKKMGQWVINVDDWELLLRWHPTSPPTVPADNSTPQGRMYYSAKLAAYRETTENNRLLESTLLFECIPLYQHTDKTFEIYTEFPTDWGVVPNPE